MREQALHKSEFNKRKFTPAEIYQIRLALLPAVVKDLRSQGDDELKNVRESLKEKFGGTIGQYRSIGAQMIIHAKESLARLTEDHGPFTNRDVAGLLEAGRVANEKGIRDRDMRELSEELGCTNPLARKLVEECLIYLRSGHTGNVSSGRRPGRPKSTGFIAELSGLSTMPVLEVGDRLKSQIAERISGAVGQLEKGPWVKVSVGLNGAVKNLMVQYMVLSCGRLTEEGRQFLTAACLANGKTLEHIRISAHENGLKCPRGVIKLAQILEEKGVLKCQGRELSYGRILVDPVIRVLLANELIESATFNTPLWWSSAACLGAAIEEVRANSK